jgi:hypothetical protein
LEDYFTGDVQVDLILEADVNYSDSATKMKINNLSQIIEDNEFYRPTVRSWYTELQRWYQTQNTNKSLLGK